MKRFAAKEWFRIVGRGRVAVVEVAPAERPAVGDIVTIDGEAYKVRGVESFNSQTHPPRPSGCCGLLVG